MKNLKQKHSERPYNLFEEKPLFPRSLSASVVIGTEMTTQVHLNAVINFFLCITLIVQATCIFSLVESSRLEKNRSKLLLLHYYIIFGLKMSSLFCLKLDFFVKTRRRSLNCHLNKTNFVIYH